MGAGNATTTGYLLERVLGRDLPIRISAYDGADLGPPGATTHLEILSPDALRRIVQARGQELGFTRALVAGEMVVHGDVFGLFDVSERVADARLDGAAVRSLASSLGLGGLRDVRRLDPPPEEIRLKGRVHSRQRDAAAISSHYDVSNDFYDLVLGRAMTYSCAVYELPGDPLFTAQQNKHDLVCRKLKLRPGMRHLDVGCGWGSMVLHAAKHYGVKSVGVTISVEQAERARKRVADAGLSDQIEIRIQDYRDVDDGPFDAISSIGMSEHVGDADQLRRYFSHMHSLLASEGRFLNHAISRAPHAPPGGSDGFIQRYVFPDGELHEVGATITAMQEAGFEARHMESFRLHYARTLRAWVGNLQDNWDAAVNEVGYGRAMVWRLYMAGSAIAFERGSVQLHQVLCIRDDASSESSPLLTDWAGTRAR